MFLEWCESSNIQPTNVNWWIVTPLVSVNICFLWPKTLMISTKIVQWGIRAGGLGTKYYVSKNTCHPVELAANAQWKRSNWLKSCSLPRKTQASHILLALVKFCGFPGETAGNQYLRKIVYDGKIILHAEPFTCGLCRYFYLRQLSSALGQISVHSWFSWTIE